MQNKPRTDSNLKVIFQTAAAFVTGLVGENPATGLYTAAHIFDSVKTLKLP